MQVSRFAKFRNRICLPGCETVYMHVCTLCACPGFSPLLLLCLAGKQHNSEFSRLIAQVRCRLETARKREIKQEVMDEGGEEDQGVGSSSAGTTVTLINMLRGLNGG